VILHFAKRPKLAFRAISVASDDDRKLPKVDVDVDVSAARIFERVVEEDDDGGDHSRVRCYPYLTPLTVPIV
jgi:hypothetical protein